MTGKFYDEERNPNGILNLATAENLLLSEELSEVRPFNAILRIMIVLIACSS